MPHAIRFHKTGGPEVLQWEEVAVGDPGPGEARVRLKAVGLNYIDTYHRSGLYPLPLPSAIGREGAGVVEAVGSAVTDLKPGDRVAWTTGPLGTYAEVKLHPAERLVKLPDAISFEQAACMMLQGLTVHYLLRRTYAVKSGDTILFHAAAGGVGLIACQWAKALGASLIGTVGSEEKAALAREYGAAHTIIYTKEDFLARVKEITGGKGVPTTTPTGKYTILDKVPAKHMGYSYFGQQTTGNVLADVDNYVLPGVPWTSFFTPLGHAFHGTYWHENFGSPMSHGCINMRSNEANWIFRWTKPVHIVGNVATRGLGTTVEIHY